MLAVCNAAGAAELPVTVRCHAHQMAGALLHEYTLEQGRAVQHLRTALGLCGKLARHSDCWLATACASVRVCIALLRSGSLHEARSLLAAVRGQFKEHATGVRRSDLARIEQLMRAGKKQLERLRNPNMRRITYG